MNYKFIKTNITKRKGIIILNRPDKRNAFNSGLVTELKYAFSAMEENQDVKVVILKAEGKVFSAGVDLSYLQQLQKNTFQENLQDSNHLKELYLMIYTLQKPVIAMVQGHAIAGGCGLANVCDFIIASAEAKFGYTEVKIGFVPAIVMVFLIRKIGEGKARELLLGGKLITAETALSYGLVNRVVPPDQLGKTVEQYAENLITDNSAASMMMIKKMINELGRTELASGLDYASEMNAKARSMEDCLRGIDSFLKKETIRW